ncbi:CHAT domain-containing protein [Leptolyngbya sp. AN02str]|uniref:CHAT domain-containing protein n=1 Tax=Leptolyngbya sp. AN02str TaxID=3423363 RepID=UPI003D312469
MATQKTTSARWMIHLARMVMVMSAAIALPSEATAFTHAPQPDIAPTSVPSLEQSRALYDAGRYPEAIALLQQSLHQFETRGDRIGQALALSNLALVYQQTGQWNAANGAIGQALSLVEQERSPNGQQVKAQALNLSGQLLLAQGQAERALATWEQAAAAFEQIQDEAGVLTSQLNQAQALQALGFYRRAIALLTQLAEEQQAQPNSLTKALTLRSLGDALRIAGNLSEAKELLAQSLNVAELLAPSVPEAQEAIAAAQLSFGNVLQVEATAELGRSGLSTAEAVRLVSQPPAVASNPSLAAIQRRQQSAARTFLQQTEVALQHYADAAAQSPLPTTQVQAQLNAFTLLVETERWSQAQALYPTINAQLNPETSDRTSIFNQINLAESLMTSLQQAETPLATAGDIAHLLATAAHQAKTIGDVRAQSFAVGTLGKLYEMNRQWADAQTLTQDALALAQTVSATDIAYQWQWQLGRLLVQQRDSAGAIAAYSQAVASLQLLRSDLVAINRDVQFTFRERVEPVYRDLVGLLLTPEPGQAVSRDRLTQARDVIEALQIAELDNFFREACLDAQFALDRVVDQAQESSAVVYPIVLGDRLEIILKLPQQELIHHTVAASQAEVTSAIDTLMAEVARPYFSQAQMATPQRLYNWLIRPIEAELTASQIETLVFVPDGPLRNLPLAVLHDGQQYLIESYSLALAPGLQLPDPQPIQQRDIRALVAGLSEARDEFQALTFVKAEVAQIRGDIPSEVLLDQEFTRINFRQELTGAPFSIVHVATHGQFSSNADETFILAWDDRIDVNELSELLRGKEAQGLDPIELLVLSACRTAVGDRRAALGMAGVAVRAGARSTIASFWSVDDESTALLMSALYRQLSQNPISKAEALRRAQLELLRNPQFRAPRFWAAYVLLGNWL